MLYLKVQLSDDQNCFLKPSFHQLIEIEFELQPQGSNDLSSETIVTCPKSELVYDRSVVTSSITEDFGMVCEDSYQKALFIALYALGRLIGKFVNTNYDSTKWTHLQRVY